MPCMPSLGSESVRPACSRLRTWSSKWPRMAPSFLSRHLTCAPPFIRSLRLCHCGLGWKRDGHCTAAAGSQKGLSPHSSHFCSAPKLTCRRRPFSLWTVVCHVGNCRFQRHSSGGLEIPRYVSVAGNSIARHLLPCCWHSAVHRKGADG